MLHRTLAAWALALAAPAMAQHAARPAPGCPPAAVPAPGAAVAAPSPASASLPSPVASGAHRSAFDGYRRFADEPLTPWRAANAQVARAAAPASGCPTGAAVPHLHHH